MKTYKDLRYNPTFTPSTKLAHAKEIKLWQDRITELEDNCSETVFAINLSLCDKSTKRKIQDKMSNDTIQLVISHHEEQIKKLLNKNSNIGDRDLCNKGLHLYKVDGVKIPLNPDWKNIVVMLSGGADSACLTYTLCKLIKKHKLKIRVHVMSGIRVWKNRPWASDVSQNVYNYLKTAWPKIIGARHSYFIPPYFEHGNLGNAFDGQSGEAIILTQYIEYLCITEKYDAVFDATTENPPNYSDKRMEARDPGSSQILLSAQETYWKLGPLQTTKKDWVIKQYKDNNILDLLKLTRSCEGEFVGLDHTTYIPGQHVPECGDCFWCKERSWALKENNIEL